MFTTAVKPPEQVVLCELAAKILHYVIERQVCGVFGLTASVDEVESVCRASLSVLNWRCVIYSNAS